MTNSHMHIDCDSALAELQVILFYFIFYQLIFFLGLMQSNISCYHTNAVASFFCVCEFVFLKFPFKIHDVQNTMSNMAKLL